ncbi:non-ribosomal peptide synthetase [Actinomadura violacea]|uniref:Amino acid adenylation domain-containing protein n=1 Tax=Actinomadura violacea TaxID=2819934 RepID=A0ABS3RNI2_9ACTN|nr:non-ribosomal peptide synthetase [Actinomadura violacea]MBO2458317.1 amino acid adenylation domain-containing protein [Actinomadura violacea]
MTVNDVEALREELLRRRLAGLAGAGPRDAAAPAGIPAADRTGRLPLSAQQRQLWFLNRLDPDSTEYLIPMVLRLRGPLDAAALGAAWARLTARHEVLRTRFDLDGAEPVQLIDPPGPAPAVEDVPGGTAEHRAARALEIAAAEASTPFDLAAEPPARPRLLRIADDDHLFCLIVHHIAFDGMSQHVLARDLTALYRAETLGTPLPPAPRVQYADYAAWQLSRRDDAAVTRDLAYWRTELAGLEPLEPPADHARPAVRDWRGAAAPVPFTPELSRRVRETARERGTTPFAVLLTGFHALLSRYTGRTDIAVGTPVSGRREELDALIGDFVGSVVLRARWTGAPGFGDLLDAARPRVAAALDHAGVPFERLADELAPERDLSRTPLFQVAFALHDAGPVPLDLPAVRVEPVELPWRTAKFDLTLQVEATADGFRGQLEYGTALFEAATVERMAGHYVRLLGAALERPDIPVADLPMLHPGEVAELTRGPRRPAAADEGVALHERVAAWADRTPGAVAVVAGDERWTYARLDAEANKIARMLRARGVRAGEPVGVRLGRSARLAGALLGVLKAGAAYLPLDPVHPPERSAFMRADAGARLVLTERDLVEPLDAKDEEDGLIVLDGSAVRADLAATPDTPPPGVAVHPDDPAYIIYTSGSTGLPKGVCVSHANVSRLFATADEHFGYGPDDVWTLFHSYAFDFSVWELWGALCHGGRVVVVDEGTARSPEDLLALLVAERVTILNQTPSAFRALTAVADARRVADLSLRAVVFGGERLDPAVLRPWADLAGLDRPELVNMYGITETTVHVTYRRLDEADVYGEARSPIGVPLGDLSVVLLDERGNPVPEGAAGEIHVGGAGPALGYLGRPALTAERFVPDPYGPPGARLYRSGDLARRLPGGALEFIGRIDAQVKIRGYRIEPEEIEVALRKCAGVRDARVVVRADGGHQELVAYVVPGEGGEGGEPSPARLGEELGRTLPPYMVPAAFVMLERFPLTPSGKLDHRSLPAPHRSALRVAGARVAPRTDGERRLAGIWAAVLGHDEVGVDDGFFDLGGDSIRAVALVGALRGAGFDVAVRDVLEHRTVARLAEAAAARAPLAGSAGPVAPFAMLEPADAARLRGADGVQDAYPLSKVQAGMLFEMLSGEDRNYHNVTTFTVRDDAPFDEAALRAAAAEVVARHDVLRTSIVLDRYAEPLQIVHDTGVMRVGSRDLSGLAPAERDASIAAFMAAERATPFDLDRPPLLRVFAHVYEPGRWRVSITECHAILEGWSYHSLLMELLTCYRRFRDGREPEPYDRPDVRYADYVAAERRALQSTADRDHWQRIVEEHPRLTLPPSWADEGPRTRHQVRVPYADLEDRLRALATDAGVSFKSVMLGAHLKVMSMVTHERSFHAGLVCDTRPEETGAERVYGMYLNTVPIPFERGHRTWRDLVRGVFQAEVDLWPHRRYPLSQIQADAGGGERLVDVFFNYLDFHVVDTDLVDYQASVDDSPNEFPLSVITQAGALVLVTDTGVLGRDAGRRLGEMYRAVLEAMAADADGDARRTFLPETERDLLLRRWNDTASPRDPDPVHRVFERLAARTPSATAVVHGEGGTTYAELDAAANRAAHHLRALGVGPETVVGVMLGRGPLLLPWLLGVWKAGGAYVPLDAAYPPERLGFMLADSGASVLVTESGYRELLAGAFDGPTVYADLDAPAVGARPADPPDDPADPDGLAYVIYTSGSTGRPKGVLVPHRGLANYLWWTVEGYTGNGSGGAPLFSSIAFDMVVPNLYAPLMTGQPVHMIDQDVPAIELGRALADAGPFDFIKLTPGHLELLTHQLGADEAGRLAALLAVGADAFPGRTLNRWLELAPGPIVLNEYGPTEISVANSTHAVTGPEDRELVPIGRPIPNSTMYVLDETMMPVPVGVPGELYIGGVGLARGYAGRAALSAERFVPDPFGGQPGARLYRTGDLARVLPGGDVDFLGRLDEQIKIRGYRIEPGEVQAVLTGHPGVAEALVLAHGRAERKRLVAYCVPAGGGLPDQETLRDYCRDRLPEHMVPGVFVALDEFPLNRNGKLDRKALPVPAVSGPGADGTGGVARRAPRTEAERALADLWAELLDVPEVAATDDFFALGGHSLLMLRVVARARAAGMPLGTRDVLECRTVEALARRSEAAAAQAQTPAQAGARDRERLVWLRRDGAGRPLFCVHPAGGSAHWYLPLADPAFSSGPVAAFEAEDMPGREASPALVEELAAVYAAELPAADAGLPPTLLAWSSASTIAWSMARRMAEQGTAPRLVLVDPQTDLPWDGPGVDDPLVDRLAELFAARADLTELAGRRTGLDAELVGLLALANIEATPATLDAVAPRVATWRLLTRSMQHYAYAPMRGRITLVLTDECASGRHSVSRDRGFDAYLARWRELAPDGLDVVHVPGEHDAALTRAEELRPLLYPEED